MQFTRLNSLLGLAALMVAIISAALVNGTPGRSIIRRIDDRVLEIALDLRSAAGLDIAAGISQLGNTAGAVLTVTAMFGFLMFRRQPRAAAFLLASSIGGYALSTVTKMIVDRSRPDEAVRAIVIDSGAFPSGHAWHAVTIYGAFAVALLMTYPNARRRVVVAITTALVLAPGLARLYLGVHWLSDVIGGWLLGCIWLSICYLLFHHRESTGT